MNNKLPVWELMSPAMRAVVLKSAELAPAANDTSGGFQVMRAAYTAERAYWNQGGPIMAESRDAVIATPDGDVPVRLHVPQGAEPRGADSPAIVYLHGGGFILGNLDTHDRIMRVLADETAAVVVGVDYSLSPEAQFPVAVRQCAAVARWLHDTGAAGGIDPEWLGFAGDSGGAMLSLAAYLYLRDEGGGADYIRALLLYYGLYGLDDSKSRRLLGGSWDGLTKADLDYYMDCYLAQPGEAASPYVDLLGADLSRVPPAFIAAAELDPLRDDSATLAAMLGAHGQPCRHVVYPGVLHAFLHYSRDLPEALDALRDGAGYFRELLATAPS